MDKINHLDCSLRDGGYYNNWDFDNDLINQYLQVLESINTSDAMYRKNRESLFIQQFDLIRKGMNGKS